MHRDLFDQVLFQTLESPVAASTKITKGKNLGPKKPAKRYARRLNFTAMWVIVSLLAAVALAFLPWSLWTSSRNRETVLEQAKKSAELGDVDLAIRHLDRYLAENINDIPVLEAKGNYLADSARSGDRMLAASKILDHLLKIDPRGKGRLETRRKLAALYISYSDAIRRFAASKDEAEAQAKESRYLAALAVIKELLEYEEPQGVRINENDPVGHRLRAMARMGQVAGLTVKSVEESSLLQEAEAELKLAIKLDPRDLIAPEKLAELYLTRLNDPVAAEKTLDALLKAMPDSVDVRIARYKAFLSSKRPVQARAELEAALTLEPKNVVLLTESASNALVRRDLVSARKYLESLPANLQKDDLRVRVLRGYLEFAESNPDDAVEQWRKGLSLVGGSDQELTWKLAYNLIQLGRLSEAYPLVNQYLRLAKPKDALGTYLQALYDQKSGHLWDSIIKLEKISNQVPSEYKSDALVALGRSYQTIGEDKKALLAYQNASVAAPGSSTPRRAIALLVAPSEPDRALSEIETALARSPDDTALLVDLIQLRLGRLQSLPPDQRRSKEVEDLLARLEKLVPNNLSLQALRAVYLASTSRLDEAVVLLGNAAKGAGRTRPDCWIAWAEGLEKLNRFDDAIKALDQGSSSANAGDHTTLRIFKARLLLRLGNGQAAREVLTKDLESIPKPERPGLSRELGEVLRALGDRDGARKAYAEWARLTPESPSPALILLSLAQVDGDDEAAKLGLQALRSLGRENEPYALAARALELLRTDPRRTVAPTEDRLREAERVVADLYLKAPDLTEIALIQGMILEYRGKPEEAAASYSRAIRIGRITPALPRLISIYMKLGQFDKLADLKKQFDAFAGNKQSSIITEFDRISAEVALRLGDKERAVRIFGQIAERRPDDLQFRLAQAQILENNGKIKEAEERYRDLAKSFPENPLVWRSLIRFEASKRTKEGVDRAIQEALQKYTGERPELFRAQCYFIGNDKPNATRFFQEALDKRPNDLATLQGMIEFKEATGQGEQAEPLLRKVLQMEPAASWASRALALRISARQDPATWPEAWALVAPGSPGSGDSPQERLIRATVLVRSPENARRSEAIRAFAALAQDLPITNPIGIEARIKLAQAMLENDRVGDALLYITPLADDLAHPNTLALMIAIEAAARSGKKEEAERRYEQLTALIPNSTMLAMSSGWVNLAKGKKSEASSSIRSAFEKVETTPEGEAVGIACIDFLLRYGDLETALPIARRVATRWPRDAWNLARVQLALKEYDQVLQSCQIALEAGSGRNALRFATAAAFARRHDTAFVQKVDAMGEVARNQDRRDVHILLFLATLRHIQEHYEEELDLYRAVIELKPANAQFLNNMAWTLCEGLNKPEEALKRIEDAINREGPAPQYLDTRGVILGRLKKHDQAIKDLEESVKGDPSPLTYFHLARAYLKANKPEESRRCRDLALSKGFNLDDLDPTDRADVDEVMGKK